MLCCRNLAKYVGNKMPIMIDNLCYFSADPIENFLNSNWRDVMEEVAPPIVYAIVDGVVKGVKAVYKAIPVDELAIA